jgi:predicted transcriptional regulator
MIAHVLSSVVALPLSPPDLLRAARRHHHLSQRDMASRAGTAQSVVARIESGRTDPSSGTLRRLLAAVGLELACELRDRVEVDPQLLDDVPRILALTPEERLEEVRNLSRFEAAARRT